MPDLSPRGIVRAAIKDVIWGYLSEREAGVAADELLELLPGLICEHPLAFNLGVEALPPDGRYMRVVSEWQPNERAE